MRARPRIVRRAPQSRADLPGDLHPVLARVYRNRGVQSAGELERSLEALIPPSAFDAMPGAVELLVRQIESGGHVLIVGDFDADGATSVALCMNALRDMGCAKVSYLVPNRFEFGYGLTPEIVALALERAPDLIVTVDNGVSSSAGVAAAKQAGVEVLVTDHHLAGSTLPDAAAILNPNLPGESFPSKALAGCGVAFYLMLAVRAALREKGSFAAQGIAEPNLAELLDLVALGTVADVVPLDANNRVLVHQGLGRIRAGRVRPGIEALLRVAGRDPKLVQAADMGFAVGPRLNAAGRLEDMSLGIECLLASDPDTALNLAQELDRLNRERRSIEEEMKQQALAMLEELPVTEGPALPLGLCLFEETWHEGVIGILAARVRERVHRPVIAFARAGDGGLKGSARSIPGLHIRDVLDEVASRHPELLSKFGGHAMAAGLSLADGDLEAFREAFNKAVAMHLNPDDLDAVVHTDGEIEANALRLELAEQLQAGGPWGQAFPEPSFDGEFQVTRKKVVGERHWKLTLVPVGGRGNYIDAIAFGQVEHYPELPGRLRLVYVPEVNEWQGRRNLQLRVQHLEPA